MEKEKIDNLMNNLADSIAILMNMRMVLVELLDSNRVKANEEVEELGGYIGAKEAAEYLNCSDFFVRSLCDKGILKSLPRMRKTKFRISLNDVKKLKEKIERGEKIE